MATKITVTATKNGASTGNHDVFFRDSEALDFGPLWVSRWWKVIDYQDGDVVNVSAVSITPNVSNPIGGFFDPDWFRGITLAFIDAH